MEIHRFLNFREVYPFERRMQYENKAHLLLRKEIAIPHSLDMDLLRKLEIAKYLDLFLEKRFYSSARKPLFASNAWRNVFSIAEPIYKELTIEFFATAQFDFRTKNLRDNNSFRFRLGGVEHTCSVMELSWRLGIYAKAEAESDECLAYLVEQPSYHADKFDFAHAWEWIRIGMFADGTSALNIKRNIHKLVYHLIVNTIQHHPNPNSMYPEDLWLLHCCTHDEMDINIPYEIAYLLGVVAGGAPPSNFIVGGHFVTRLARSYGILANDAMLSGLERIEPRYMDVAYLDSIGIMTITESPTYEPGEPSNSQPSVDSQLGTEIETLKVAFGGMEKMLDYLVEEVAALRKETETNKRNGKPLINLEA